MLRHLESTMALKTVAFCSLLALLFSIDTRLQKHLELMAELIKHLTNSVLNKILQNKRQSYK